MKKLSFLSLFLLLTSYVWSAQAFEPAQLDLDQSIAFCQKYSSIRYFDTKHHFIDQAPLHPSTKAFIKCMHGIENYLMPPIPFITKRLQDRDYKEKSLQIIRNLLEQGANPNILFKADYLDIINIGNLCHKEFLNKLLRLLFQYGYLCPNTYVENRMTAPLLAQEIYTYASIHQYTHHVLLTLDQIRLYDALELIISNDYHQFLHQIMHKCQNCRDYLRKNYQALLAISKTHQSKKSAQVILSLVTADMAAKEILAGKGIPHELFSFMPLTTTPKSISPNLQKQLSKCIALIDKKGLDARQYKQKMPYFYFYTRQHWLQPKGTEYLFHFLMAVELYNAKIPAHEYSLAVIEKNESFEENALVLFKTLLQDHYDSHKDIFTQFLVRLVLLSEKNLHNQDRSQFIYHQINMLLLHPAIPDSIQAKNHNQRNPKSTAVYHSAYTIDYDNELRKAIDNRDYHHMASLLYTKKINRIRSHLQYAQDKKSIVCAAILFRYQNIKFTLLNMIFNKAQEENVIPQTFPMEIRKHIFEFAYNTEHNPQTTPASNNLSNSNAPPHNWLKKLPRQLQFPFQTAQLAYNTISKKLG